MIDEVLSDLAQAISKAHDALRRELGKLRTGRAHPGMLDTIRVDYYGQTTPLSQMAYGWRARAPDAHGKALGQVANAGC